MEGFLLNTFNLILAMVIKIVQVLLIPIDFVIAQAIPDVSNAIDSAIDLFVLIGNSLGWAISVSGLPFPVIVLIGLYMSFAIIVPFNMWLFKVAIKYYRILKP